MNWERIDKIISEIDKPITLFLSLILNQKNMKKKNLDFIYRLYIKHHFKTLLDFPIIKLFNSMKVKVQSTILKFYKFYFKLINSYNNIIELKIKFIKYKHLTLKELENKIENNIKIFNSYFDATHSNNNFHSKLMQYFCNIDKNISIENEIKKRLYDSLEFIGIDFALHFDIPLKKYSEFNSLNGIDKFKFMNNYYSKTIKVLKTINLNVKKINIYKNLLINLSQPKNIKITIINNLNSETENDDFEIFHIN